MSGRNIHKLRTGKARALGQRHLNVFGNFAFVQPAVDLRFSSAFQS